MRVGVAGLGRVGRMHARNLARTAGVGEVVLIGRDAGRVHAALAQVDAALADDAPVELTGNLVPAGSTAARLTASTGGLADALEGLDAVVLATPTATHPDLVRRTAQAGVPTLVEKPLALDPDRLEQLAREIEATGTDVAVAFHRRYDPGHQRLRQRVQAGDAGRLRMLRATGHDHLALSLDYIPQSGGIWLDMLIHDFDAIPWIAGERVVSVYATGSVLDEPLYGRYDDVDTAAATLTLQSGAIAVVTGERRNGAGQDVRLEVFGTDNTFGAGIEPSTPVTSTEPSVPGPAAPYDQFIDRFEAAFRAEAAHFVGMAGGELPNLTPPRAGLEATRIAVAAAQSQHSGLPVSL